jgi:cell division protease FtsH
MGGYLSGCFEFFPKSVFSEVQYWIFPQAKTFGLFNYRKGLKMGMEPSKKPMSKKKKILLAVLIPAAVAAIACAILIPLFVTGKEPEEVSYPDFCAMVEKKEVEKVIYTSGSPKMKFEKTGSDAQYETDNPKVEGFKEKMLLAGVEFEEIIPSSFWSTFFSLLLTYLPFALILFLVFRMIPGRGFAVEAAERPDTTFDDVAGLDEIKQDMMVIAETLKDPSICQKLGAHITKGVLLEGDPGNGKTLFARALAGETGVNFYSANASEFIEMYAGLGASRVRKLFKEAKANAPSVVFIDELDAIGSKRDGSTDGAGREYTQCLNALLSAIDGFEASDGVLVIGATNRAEDLDPALVRPGRFDKQFVLTPPDCAAREQILRLHAKGKAFASDVDFAELAKDTVGMSGAGLEALLNEAAMQALIHKAAEITRQHIEAASIQMELKGHIKRNIGNRNREEHKVICYHEAGHTVATVLLTDHLLRRVTVLPTTSGAGGVTMSAPPADKHLHTLENLRRRAIVLYAGRAAEYRLAGEQESQVSTGASDDIRQATSMIQSLAAFSQQNGLLDYSDFGRAGEKKVMDQCEVISKQIWQETVEFTREHWDKIDAVAKELMEKDTLGEEEIRQLVGKSEALPAADEDKPKQLPDDFPARYFNSER